MRITRTEYVPVDASLTAATPSPAAPAPLCTDAEGPLLCNGQLTDWRAETDAALQRCNADKAAIALLEPPR